MELEAQNKDLKRGMSGPEVATLQNNLTLIGYTIADKELADDFFGNSTHEAVVDFQKKSKLVPNGIFDAKAAWMMDDDHEHPTKFIVLGQVLKANGDPFPGLTVKAFDKDLRSEQLLKSDTTRDNGEYNLFYQTKDFSASEKGRADLFLRVFDGTVLQATSAIIFNADKVETVNFTIGVRSEFDRIVNEISTLLNGVTYPNLTGEDVSFLSGETRIDAAWLTLFAESARRNRDANTVPHSAFYGLFRQGLPTVLTELLQNEIPVLRAALEASSNEGIIPSLSAAQLDQIAANLQALKANLILQPGNPGNISSFGDLLKTTALSDANRQLVAELQVQHGANTESFWTAVMNHQNLSPSDKTDVRFTLQVGGLTTNHIPLVAALRNAAPPGLIVEVNGPVPPAALSEDATALRPFAVKGVADWKSLLQPPSGPSLGTPPTIPGATAQEKIDNYAVALNAYMENALPTPVIAGRVEKDVATDSPFRPVITDLRTFFRNNRAYEFGNTPIDVYLSVGRDQKLTGVVNPTALIAELKNMQRLFNVAPRYGEIRSLRKDDLHSAMSMVKLGQRRFTEKYAASLGGADKALEVYRKAQQTHATALNFYLNRALPASSPAPFVIPNGNGKKVSAAKLAAVNGTPDLTTLFGSLDLCECDQCQSVYSPAAYFVDILKFLGDGPIVNGQNPLQVLLGRRPDLEHIELTCENTSTEVPYVDLTREIMERAVAKREFAISEGSDISQVLSDLDQEKIHRTLATGVASKGYPLTDKASVRREPFMEFAPRAWVILDSGWAFTLKYPVPGQGFKVEAWPQTSWTADELRATPEHVNDAAYTTLRNAVYPWDLPLNLPVEEARVYLNHFGVKKHEVMETFFRGTPIVATTDKPIANEYLGLTKKEADIITGNNSPAIDPWKFWGLQETGNDVEDPPDGIRDWDVVLKRVSIFLQQSGMTYRDLLELMGCYFINPATSTGRMLAIVSSDPTTCKLNEMEIRVVDPAFPDNASKRAALKVVWNKIHRFARLQRKLGWTMRDLDKAIMALNPVNPDITSNFLLQLSHIERLRAQFDLPVVNVLSFWAAIDTGRYRDHFAEGEPAVPSLYAQLFNNKSAAGQSLAEDPATLTGKLSENAPAIAAALQVTVDELNLMIADLNVVPEDKLSLDNLSKLYRHATLARALNYSIRAYLSALKMISAAPFTTTADTISFAKQSEKILAAGFSVEDLNYILRHDFSSTSQIAIDDDAIAVVLNSIRGEVRKITTENSFVEVSSDATAATNDRDGDLTKRKLALLNWDTGLIEQLVAILNGTFTHEAKLDALPQGIVFPAALQGRVSYDSIAGQLRFTGVMTASEKSDLLAASSDSKYQGAVQVLFEAPAKFVKRHMARFSAPRFTADLAQFPPTVVIPAALKTRFYYDGVAKKLIFAGIMTEAERRVLIANEPKDADGVPTSLYGLAVVALFNAGSVIPPAGDADAFITAADVSALFDDSGTTPPARFIIVLRKLMPYLRTTLSERIVTQRLTEILQLDAKAAQELLTKWVNSPADPTQKAIREFLAPSFAESNANVVVTRNAFPRQFNTFMLLYKIAVLSAKFSLTSQQLQWLFEYGPGNGWLDLNSLPIATVSAAHQAYAGWARLADLFAVRDAFPLGEALLTDIFTASRDTATPLNGLLTLISKGAGWKLENLTALSAANGFNFPVSAYKDEAALRRLQAAFAMLDQLGASAEQCLSWTALDSDEARCAQDVKSLVRAKLDDAQWVEVAKTLNDPLRERQRAALVSYLIQATGTQNANELYDDFLVDVEMSPCMMTTRLKQAIGSIQLFIQRSLMRLEEEVSMTETEAREWAQWRKQYRVWEANRKVLLYPENWIEPELRDGKTPFFEDLESELLQSDVTMDTAETAFLHYLEKLQEVSRLEIVGMYRQIESGITPPIDITHVIGRTFSAPHVYYYRRQIDSAYWTPWEKIEVDIQGDHVIPLIWNRRLYVFWPMFATKQRETAIPGSGAKVNPGEKVLEVQLAWTEHKNGKWSSKKLTSAFQSRLKHPDAALTEADFKLFSFKSRVQTTPAGEKQLFIDCYGPVDTVTTTSVPPGSTLPRQEKLLFSLLPDGRKSIIATINNALFQPSAKTKIAIEGRIGDTTVSTAQLSDDGRVEVRNQTQSTLKYFMVSSDYIAQNIVITGQRQICWIAGAQNPNVVGGNGNAPAPALALAGVDSALTPVLTAATSGTKVCEIISEAECTFDLVPLQPANGEDTVTTTSTAAMQAIASFHFDDGQQSMTPLFNSTAITSIEPIVGTRYENMMMVEYDNPSGGLGQSKILQVTPTTFRLLGMHQSYIPKSLLVPIFFQDDARTYFVVGINGATKVRFNTFFHPTVRSFFKSLNRDGISGLLKLSNQLVIDSPAAFDDYHPDPTRVEMSVKPREDVDFSYSGAYSVYNWELFFHAPFMIATQLSKNQRFEEAQKWFHYIFDPTATESPENAGDPGPERFWRVKPLYRQALEGIPTIDELLADPDGSLQAQIKEWQAKPFNPHVIARLRLVTYMKAVVMHYIDNLIAWGDQLFRRDTIESINEATQLYILAAQILGRRPEQIPPRVKAKVNTFHTLDDDTALNSLANASVDIEGFLSSSMIPSSDSDSEGGLPLMPFFGVPGNDKLLAYWNTVADRLFKIRHCQNIDGIVRSLPTFEPPIDPALLVKSAAAGVDIASALSDINVALPHYRFNVMLQKAVELCGEVKSLGGALLSALEKRDAEALALLRSTHEQKVLKAARTIKERQLAEAKETRDGLDRSKELTTMRRNYYRDITFMNPWEKTQLDLVNAGIILQGYEVGSLAVASVVGLIPNFKIALPTSMGSTYGGENLSQSAEHFSSSIGKLVSILNSTASMAGTMGGHQRRFDDWKLQERLANKELEQIEKQIAAADIRVAIAEKELSNHDLQVENTREVDEFMRSKFTNRELYDWMVGQISGIYFQSYQLAYDVAKRAERAYRHELGVRESSFIQFGYWDSLKKGLLAGERLSYDLKRMEVAYLDQNRREYEIVKHVSLLSIDPVSLVKLKQTGECFVTLPEALFDIDYAGHYMRRIKSVGITVPCVAGPYSGINCTLTLQSSSIRHSNTLSNSKYGRQTDDPRFADSVGTVQSIVTSGAQNDSGMFETNLHDERYLPFEGQGAISTWRIEMPKNFKSFDYNTISDVVLHVRYTARDGGAQLKAMAEQELQTALNEFVRVEGAKGLTQMFSLRHEFSTEWSRFLNAPSGSTHSLTMAITKERFPSVFQAKNISIKTMEVYVKAKTNPESIKIALAAGPTAPAPPSGETLALSAWNGLMRGTKEFNNNEPGTFTLNAWRSNGATVDLNDIIVVCRYTVS